MTSEEFAAMLTGSLKDRLVDLCTVAVFDPRPDQHTYVGATLLQMGRSITDVRAARERLRAQNIEV